MSDLFQPISWSQLTSWVFDELEQHDALFGIPRRLLFVPHEGDLFATTAFHHALESPFGPAAGPHSQMAQNIVTAWACGARYIELKTVQTIDELNVSKPCIDMEDEGYNVEWSQELKVFQSFDEYLRAWILIHALHRALGFPGDGPGVVFNLSVGYNLEGIQKPNMQWFLRQMKDCSAYKQPYIDELAHRYPAVRDLAIPDCISDNVTLSTMHGCPPQEIESICTYLMTEWGLHTYVKCNPTLLGPEKVRTILHQDLHYTDVVVPDVAFEHDLTHRDAVPMLQRLRQRSAAHDLQFGVKLSNTLEVENVRGVFADTERMMYLSGRPLHALTVNLAHVLSEEFDGMLPLSFSAGADCFSAPHLVAAGMQTITVCSDLLKSGGYLRLLQYFEILHDAMQQAGATDLEGFICASDGGTDPARCARNNLRRYAEQTRRAPMLQKGRFLTSRSKTARALGYFDCIAAPCVDECPINQKVPQYMEAVRTRNFAEAVRLARQDNPIPAVLGRVCDHLCEHTCIRTHYDEPLAIRDIKRFIMERPELAAPRVREPSRGVRVAIVGAGPGGLAAASELVEAGCDVEIFEMHPYAGGMVGGAIPRYRLPQAVIDQDVNSLTAAGVRIHYGMKAGRDVRLSDLRTQGFSTVVIMAGAQRGKRLGLEGEDCDGVMDALYFLRNARERKPIAMGARVAVIGAGDTAMDCARTAWRLGARRVTVIYRRTIDQMPADREEVRLLLEEGIDVLELAKPLRLHIEDGRLKGLVCRRMEYRGDRDASGRKIPHDVEGTELAVELDTMILAISQHAILDFFDGEPIAINRWGYIEADPESLETSVPGVYAGGDVANEGPSSIVQAAADGKRIAGTIAGHGPTAPDRVPATVDVEALLRRRAHREWRVPVPHRAPGDRQHFEEVVGTYSEEQAVQEASRCLDCHHYCSICVGVCPNLALLTYVSRALDVRLSEIRIDEDRAQVVAGSTWRTTQDYQIAVLTDFCNECGNCTTFCPTAGAPYRDKPRLYLNRPEFDAQIDNAFMIFREKAGWAIDARWAGATHRLEHREHLIYRSPSVMARIHPDTLAVLQAEPGPMARDGESESLAPCVAMYVLLEGLRGSMSYLPTADAGHGTRVGHPGYPEEGQ